MVEKNIAIKKRNNGVVVLQLALNAAGFSFSYPQAVLLDRINHLLGTKGDKTDLKDLCELTAKWKDEFLIQEDK